VALVPEKRVDKNGVMRTRWVRSLVNKSTAILNAPKLAKLSEIKRLDNNERIASLKVLFREADTYFMDHRLRHAFENYGPEQLKSIDDIIAATPKMDARNRRVLCDMFNSAEAYNGDILIEGFLLREAFCGPYATLSNLKLLEPLEYVLGVRDDFNVPLDLNDEKVFQETVALMRYAYEMHFRNLADVEPHTTITYSQEHQMLGRNYSDTPLLKELVRDYPDRVEELIDLSLKHETSDAILLRSLIEHEGPTAVASGWL
jgi:hypothetical protein